MTRSVDPDSLGFVITDTGRLLRAAVEKRIAQAGMTVTPGEARALIHVAALGGGRQTALAERMGVEPMTISGYIDRLEQHGLVERRPDPTDRRAKRVYATDAADLVIDEAGTLAARVIDEAMPGIDRAERKVFEAVLRVMQKSLQGMLDGERAGGRQGA